MNNYIDIYRRSYKVSGERLVRSWNYLIPSDQCITQKL